MGFQESTELVEEEEGANVVVAVVEVRAGAESTAVVVVVAAVAEFDRLAKSSKKCEVFSYTTNVMAQAGVTRSRLGTIPL